MNYDEALAALSAYQGRGWRLGLDRMRELAARAGVAPFSAGKGVRFFHIAGTNGKGSVTAYLQSLLVSQGWRVGGFFSPYVIDPRERIQIDGRLIAPQEFVDAFLAVRPAAESLEAEPTGGVTEFEFKMALALAAWKRAGCDAIALEVGLGGRLDATNIVDPAACAIVSIGWDHMALLGGTHGEIAWEKAGILKPDRPAVIGAMSSEALGAIEAVAHRVRCPLWRLGIDFTVAQDPAGVVVHLPECSLGPLPMGIRGSRQAHNLAVAAALLVAGGGLRMPDRLAEGSRAAALPGRNQSVRWRGREWRLDGAHNVDAARSLVETLRADGIESMVLLAGMLEGHDPGPFFRELAPLVASAHLAPIDFHRSRPTEELARDIQGLLPAQPHSSLAEAIAAADRDRRELPVLVTGSFYLVGEVARAMLADGVDL